MRFHERPTLAIGNPRRLFEELRAWAPLRSSVAFFLVATLAFAAFVLGSVYLWRESIGSQPAVRMEAKYSPLQQRELFDSVVGSLGLAVMAVGLVPLSFVAAGVLHGVCLVVRIRSTYSKTYAILVHAMVPWLGSIALAVLLSLFSPGSGIRDAVTLIGSLWWSGLLVYGLSVVYGVGWPRALVAASATPFALSFLVTASLMLGADAGLFPFLFVAALLLLVIIAVGASWVRTKPPAGAQSAASGREERHVHDAQPSPPPMRPRESRPVVGHPKISVGPRRGQGLWYACTIVAAFGGGAATWHLLGPTLRGSRPAGGSSQIATAVEPQPPRTATSPQQQPSKEAASALPISPPTSSNDAGNLRRWIGRYPTEQVDGADFFTDMHVLTSLETSLDESELSLLRTYRTAVPVEETEGYLWVTVCKPHNCPNDGTIAVELETGRVFALIVRDESTVWVYPGGRQQLPAPRGAYLLGLMAEARLPHAIQKRFWNKFAPADGGPSSTADVPPASPAPGQANCRVIDLRADGRRWWQSTGLSLATGDTVDISASGDWGQSNKPVGPAGDREFVVGGPCTGVSRADCFPVWNEPAMSLVARIGEDGEAFVVGERRALRATRPGILEVAPNDRRDILWDNFGTVTVRVVACSPG